jgi:hypothetical protein
MQKFRVVEAVSAPDTNFAENFRKMLAFKVKLDKLRGTIKKTVDNYLESQESSCDTVYLKIFDNFQTCAVTKGKKVSSYENSKAKKNFLGDQHDKRY